jgi:16S rRNA processing protein RimM
VTRSGHNLLSFPSAGSGEAPSPSEPAFLAVGRISRPHGLRGELRVEIHTDYPERFATHKRLYLGPEECANLPADEQLAACIPYGLEAVRFHQGAVLIKLHGIDDRTAADAFRNQWVWIPIQDAVPLEDGECYLFQMLGLAMITVDGEELGRVVEIIDTTAKPVYIVQGPQGEILVPDIEEVVLGVDLEARQITVRLLDGMR